MRKNPVATSLSWFAKIPARALAVKRRKLMSHLRQRRAARFSADEGIQRENQLPQKTTAVHSGYIPSSPAVAPASVTRTASSRANARFLTPTQHILLNSRLRARAVKHVAVRAAEKTSAFVKSDWARSFPHAKRFVKGIPGISATLPRKTKAGIAHTRNAFNRSRAAFDEKVAGGARREYNRAFPQLPEPVARAIPEKAAEPAGAEVARGKPAAETETGKPARAMQFSQDEAQDFIDSSLRLQHEQGEMDRTQALVAELFLLTKTLHDLQPVAVNSALLRLLANVPAASREQILGEFLGLAKTYIQSEGKRGFSRAVEEILEKLKK